MKQKYRVLKLVKSTRRKSDGNSKTVSKAAKRQPRIPAPKGTSWTTDGRGNVVAPGRRG